MEVNYVAMAIPFFLISMGLEIIVSLKSKHKLYRFNDTIANLSNGLGQQATGIIFKVFYFYCYTYVYNNWSLIKLDESSPFVWMLAILIGDLSYYWFHRASHRINLLVGCHAVHHHSEEYNLSVAMRQSWFTRTYSWIFYLPLAIIGISPLNFIAVGAIVLIYQFWVHTQYIGKLGFLEKILVTPSHHRVHHGRNPEYVDKNYGAIFIWWDKLFGTFSEEKETVVYGVLNPVNSWNPLYGNFKYYTHLWREMKQTTSLKEKLQLWFMPPEWRASNLTPYGDIPNVTPQSIKKYDVHRTGAINLWIVFHFTISFALLGVILFLGKEWTLAHKAFGILLIVMGLTTIGAIQEKRTWRYAGQAIFFLSTFSFVYFSFIKF